MFDFNKLFDFLVDSNHKPSKRFIAILLGLSFLILVDRVFKFSDNYITSQKLDQVERIEKLIENEKIDTSVKKHLKDIEIEVLKRQTAWGSISDIYIALKQLINSSSLSQQDSTKRSVFWHSVSSSWSMVILMVSLIFLPLMGKRYDINIILGVFGVEFALLLLVILFSVAFALIPIIGNNPLLNYCLNFFLHFAIVYSFYKYIISKSVKTKA